MLTLFICMSRQGWGTVAYNAMQSVSQGMVAYFLVIIIFGSLLIQELVSSRKKGK